MFHGRRALVAACLTLTFAALAFAALPTVWTLENQADFLQGEVDGLSVSSDGMLSLAPTIRNLYEPTDPFVWSLVADARGNLYAGTGNEGRIFKIDASGATSVLADTNELAVQCLAVDREGTLYAGTSPAGKVYRIDAAGKMDVFFDPDEKYIWALAADESGNVFVSTGEPAKIYRVKKTGESQVAFESQETHVMCLTTDASGNLYAGSEGNGLIFKLDRAGRVSVLFDSPFQEVHALALDSKGNVYAAVLNGDKTPAAPPASIPASPPPLAADAMMPSLPAEVGDSVTVTVSGVTPLLPPVPSAPSGPARGALFRVSPEGGAEILWSSPEDVPLSLRLDRDDRLLVGTGKGGRVFAVRQDKTSSLLLKSEAEQVTAIYGADRRGVVFATSNPARVSLIGTERRLEGAYRSSVKDAQTVASWGRIRWQGRTPPGTGLSLQTRSGNSAKPDNTWSDWSPAYTLAEGDQVTSPRGRFIQWRGVLKSGTGDATPELYSVSTVYLQQNLRPEITDITVHPPGETFQKPLLTTGQLEIMGLDGPLNSSDNDFGGSLVSPWSSSGTGAGQSLSRRSSLAVYSKKILNKGFQTVSWSATDLNDDTLVYEVYYRLEGETLWKLLRRDLREGIIAWDTVAMPDGRYALKIIASDTSSNPQASALTGEKESRTFEIDNTPPRITDLKIAPGASGPHVTFAAIDDSSAVKSVEYAVDSGRWHVVYPKDGICDSKREEFDLTVPPPLPGPHTFVVKVTDRLGNAATARGELR